MIGRTQDLGTKRRRSGRLLLVADRAFASVRHDPAELVCLQVEDEELVVEDASVKGGLVWDREGSGVELDAVGIRNEKPGHVGICVECASRGSPGPGGDSGHSSIVIRVAWRGKDGCPEFLSLDLDWTS